MSMSLAPLVNSKVITNATKRKLVDTSLGLQHLKTIYKRVLGVESVFKEPSGTNNVPRITKNKQIIRKVNDYLH